MRATTAIIAFASLAASVQAHSHVYGLWVNGAFQGDGRNVYVRSPPNNSPVKDVAALSINCNANNRAVPSSVSVKGGDTVTVEWYHDNRSDDIIDLSHKGPLTVYIAPRSSDGNGAVWTKLAEDGYSNGQWAVERLVANKGKYDVKLPAGLAPGDYLLRAEIIAHHESDTDYKVNPARGAQFYPSCSQITVTSGGSQKPPGTFNFVGGYTSTDAGILFNLYGGFTSYKIPGPAVWVPGTDSVKPTTTVVAVPTTTKVTVPTTLVTVTKPTTTTKAAATTKAPAPTTTKAVTQPTVAPTTPDSSVAQKWYQCGGVGFKGPTKCVSGCTCVAQNPYYSQCL